MGRAYGGSNMPHWIRNDILDLCQWFCMAQGEGV